jgi:predicted peptidase
MKRALTLAALLLLAAPVFAQQKEKPKIPDTDDYEAKTFKAEGGLSFGYRILSPKTIEKDKKYPLVIFLHGKGECGGDNFIQLKNGATVFAKPENREKFPCFQIVPQTPNGHESSRHGTGNPNEDTIAILELIAQLQKDLPIDDKRLYLTGLSMGGWATWDILFRRPEMFAAAVPVTGGANAGTAKIIAAGKTPIWCFHGGADNQNPTRSSQEMIAALKKAGAEPKYTEYPGVGHNSWDKAYAEP